MNILISTPALDFMRKGILRPSRESPHLIMTRRGHDRSAKSRDFGITGAAMRAGDFRADVVSNWVGAFLDGELHAKPVASLSDGVLDVLNSASLAVSAIGLSVAQAHGLNAKHAKKDTGFKVSTTRR